MSILDNLKKTVLDATQSVNNELKKFRSKELLNAIVSGATMIAIADGNASASEKQKLMGYVRNSEQLSVFDTDKVIESFNQCLSRFEFDNTIASGEALQKISIFRGKPESHLIARVCLAIANADNQFDTAERYAFEQICSVLELDSKSFT